MTKSELLEKVRKITKMPWHGLKSSDTNDNTWRDEKGRTAFQRMKDRKKKPEVVHNPDLEEAKAGAKGYAAMTPAQRKAYKNEMTKRRASKEKASATWVKKAYDAGRTPWIDQEGKFQHHSGEGLDFNQRKMHNRHKAQYKPGDSVIMKDRDDRPVEVKQKKKEAEAAAKVAAKAAAKPNKSVEVAKTKEDRLALMRKVQKARLMNPNTFLKKRQD